MDEKIKNLKKIIQKTNNCKAMIKLGKIYDDLNRLSLAEKYFKMAVENNSYKGLLKLGKLYLQTRKLNLAEKCFKELADNGDHECQNYLGLVYEQQLKIDLAEKYLNLAIKGGNEKAFFNLGYLYYNEENYDCAIKIWKNLKIEEDPELCLLLAHIYHIKKNFDECEKYLKIAGESSKAYYLLGDLYREYNKPELSEKYFILGAEKDDSDCQEVLYKLYKSQNKIELSEKYLSLLIGNGNLKNVYEYAEECMNKQKFDKAIFYYKIIENKKLDFYSSHNKQEKINYNLCKAYLKVKNYEEAEKYLSIINIKNSSNICEYSFEIAKIYEENNKLKEAEKYYLHSIKCLKDLDPMDCAVLHEKIHLTLGKFYLKLDQLDLAEKYLKATEEYTDNIEIKYLLGTIYDQQNNLGLAKKYYSQIDTEDAKNKLNLIKKKENIIKNI